MSAPVLYSGPAKAVQIYGSGATPVAFQAEGQNGQIKLDLAMPRFERSTAMHGYILSTLNDVTSKISLTPFDSWTLLPVLYPTYLGVTTATGTGDGTGALLVGTRPHDFVAGTANGTAATKIWTPDGRLYNVVRTAVTKHPTMQLGVGQPLFGGMEITGLLDPTLAMGASSAMITGNAITESGAIDPDTAGFAIGFVNGHWTGAFGSVAGFTALDAEDGWTLTVDAKYSPITVQKRTYHLKLDSVQFMIKARLTGETHTQLLGQTLTTAQGAIIVQGSATNLVLTGPGSKTVTLNNCQLYWDNSGFEFGGTKLATGEVAFVTEQVFTSGVPQPALAFSA